MNDEKVCSDGWMEGAVGEEEKSEKNDDIDDRFMIHGTIVYSLYFVYYMYRLTCHPSSYQFSK